MSDGKQFNPEHARARIRSELDRKATLMAQIIELLNQEGAVGKFEAMVKELIDSGAKASNNGTDADNSLVTLSMIAMFAEFGYKTALLAMLEDAIDTGDCE